MPLIDKFNKIAQTVSNSASTIAKKSNELIEISKLNISIQTETDKINTIKIELGNKVFEKYTNNENIDLDLIDKCTQINELISNIEVLKQKIVELKNLQLCPSCNNEIEHGLVFCPKCGAVQNVVIDEPKFIQQNPNEKVCPQCNSIVSSDILYCPSCGTSLQLEVKYE